MVEPRENRVHMYLSNDERDAIDDWRFANRIATRSDAIRKLCHVGLSVLPLLELLQDEAIAANISFQSAKKSVFEALKEDAGDDPEIVERTFAKVFLDLMDTIPPVIVTALEAALAGRAHMASANVENGKALSETVQGIIQTARSERDHEIQEVLTKQKAKGV